MSNSSSSSRFRNLSISLSTLAVVALALGSYYFIYVGQREDLLHERNFRVLSQINQNALAKDQTFKRVAKNLPRSSEWIKERVRSYYQKPIQISQQETYSSYQQRLENQRQEIEQIVRDSLGQDVAKLKEELGEKSAAYSKQLQNLVLDNRALFTRSLSEDRKASGKKGGNPQEQIFLKRKSPGQALQSLSQLKRKSIERVANDSLGANLDSVKRALGEKQLAYNRYLRAWVKDNPDLFNTLVGPPPSGGGNRAATQEDLDITFHDGYFQLGKEARLPFHQVERKLSEELKMDVSLEKEQEGAAGRKGRFVKKEGSSTTQLFYASYPLQQGRETYRLSLSKDMDDFMASLIRDDVYDDFIIFLKKEEGAAEIIFQTSKIPMKVNRLPDTLLLTDKQLGLQANTLRELNLIGTNYYAYLQPMQLDEQQLIIVGLQQVERFNGEKFRVSTLLILLLALLLFIGILTLPILRLRLLSNYERLKTSDVIFSMFTAILGSAALVLLLFDTYGFNGPDSQIRKQQLVDLSSAITEDLIGELEAIYDQLLFYDQMADSIEQDVRKVASIDPKTAEPLFPKLYPQYYPFFTNVFWVGMDDTLALEITSRPDLTKKVDVSGREYLERLKAGERYQLPSGGEFMLESILTRTTGDNLAAVSKLSQKEDANIIFLATKLFSVMDVVLPQGFGFCLMEPDGRVLFHSDPDRNLQENFLEESSPKALRSAMYARSELFIDGYYQGEASDFYLRPLPNLPLFLVTFENKAFYQNTHEQIITFTFVLILISFLFGLAIVLLMVAFAPGRRRLRGESFMFSWLRPRNGRATAYRVLLFANLLTLAVLYAFSLGEKALTVINFFGMAYIYTFIMAYLALRPDPTQGTIGVRKQYRFITATIAMLIGLNLLALSLTAEEFWKTLFFQMIHLSIAGLALLAIRRLSPIHVEDQEEYLNRLWKPLRGGVQFLNVRRSYRAFLMSWLLIISVFPSVKYYSLAYSREVKLSIKHTQVQLAKDIRERDAWLEGMFGSLNPDLRALKDLKNQGIYSGPFYATIHNGLDLSNAWKNSLVLEKEDRPVSQSFSLYDSLFSRIRPRYNDRVRITNQLRSASSADSSWYWTEGKGILNEKPQDIVSTLTYYDSRGDVLLKSYLHQYRLPLPFNAMGILFWLAFIGLMVFIYYLMDFVLKKLFAENIVAMKVPSEAEVRESIATTQQDIFLIIPPRAMGSKYKQVLRGKLRLSFRDFKSLEEFWAEVEERESRWYKGKPAEEIKAERKNESIVLNHFEHQLNDLEQNKARLSIIRRAMMTWKQVIVVSSVDPFELLDTYDEKIEVASGEAKDKLEDALVSWSRTLSRFYKLDFPFETDPLEYGRGEHEALLAEECRHGAFLRYLYPELLVLYKGRTEVDAEDIVLDIELRAQLYYQVLWSASSPEERYILFDLAQDGLVNGRNIRVVKTLIRKGLVVNDGEELRIMNRSFRNFILTVTKLVRNLSDGAAR
jgi:hypothetical protein